MMHKYGNYKPIKRDELSFIIPVFISHNFFSRLRDVVVNLFDNYQIVNNNSYIRIIYIIKSIEHKSFVNTLYMELYMDDDDYYYLDMGYNYKIIGKSDEYIYKIDQEDELFKFLKILKEKIEK